MGIPWAAVRGTYRIPVTSAETGGQMEYLGRARPSLVAPSHSLAPAFSMFPPILLPLSLCLAYQLSCLSDLRPLPLPSCIPSLAVLSCLGEPAAPAPHPSCRSLKLHPWVTRHGAEPLPSEDENCTLVEVTEEEVENSVKHIPSLATVVRRMNHRPRAGTERVTRDGPLEDRPGHRGV